MKSGKADMFLYSENFAAKGPNETISCLDFYIKNRISGIKNCLYSPITVSLKIRIDTFGSII